MHHLNAFLSIIMHHLYLSQSQYHIMQCISAYLIKSQYQHPSLQVVTPEDDEGTVSALVLPDTGTITPSVSILGPSVLRARLGAQVSVSFSGSGENNSISGVR